MTEKVFYKSICTSLTQLKVDPALMQYCINLIIINYYIEDNKIIYVNCIFIKAL